MLSSLLLPALHFVLFLVLLIKYIFLLLPPKTICNAQNVQVKKELNQE